jgi:hypothetical protein
MKTTDETVLCGYEGELGRHELVAVVDERSLTYQVLVRDPDGERRLVREYVPSLRSARQWAVHHAHKHVLASGRPRLKARGRPRIVVVGFDGSDCAARGLERAASLIDDDGLLVLVAVQAEANSPGILAAPLLDTQDADTNTLLAEGRRLVSPRCTAASPAAAIRPRY